VKVASLSQIGLIAGPFNLLLAQAVYLIQPGLNLLLDAKRDFQRQRRDRTDQNLSDRLVKVLTVDVLAHRDDVVGSVALAYILRHQLRLSHVIANRHPTATDAADHQALQQRRPFAWGTLPAILAVGVSIVAEPLQVLLILHP
jgi:hypothetical protein